MRTGETSGAKGERAISMKGKGWTAPRAGGALRGLEYSRRSREAPLETPLKTLIDKFRAKPEWQHPDPTVRAEAVLRLGSNERETLLAIAREDAEARGRRAAAEKRFDVQILARRARAGPGQGGAGRFSRAWPRGRPGFTSLSRRLPPTGTKRSGGPTNEPGRTRRWKRPSGRAAALRARRSVRRSKGPKETPSPASSSRRGW